MTLIERFNKNSGCEDTFTSEEMLQRAEDEILDLTNRDTILPKMQGLQLELAIIYYNRQKDEGIKSRSEGGISISYEIPDNIKKRLLGKRRLKIVGDANGQS